MRGFLVVPDKQDENVAGPRKAATSRGHKHNVLQKPDVEAAPLARSFKGTTASMLKLLPHGKFSSVCNKVPFSFVAGDSGRTATHKEKDPYRSESVALYETVLSVG